MDSRLNVNLYSIIVSYCEHTTFIKLRKTSLKFLRLCTLDRYVEMYKFLDTGRDIHSGNILSGYMVPVTKPIPVFKMNAGRGLIDIIVSLERKDFYKKFKVKDMTFKVRHGGWNVPSDNSIGPKPCYQKWYFGDLKYHIDNTNFMSHSSYNRLRITKGGNFLGKEVELIKFPNIIRISYDNKGKIREYRKGTYDLKYPYHSIDTKIIEYYETGVIAREYCVNMYQKLQGVYKRYYRGGALKFICTYKSNNNKLSVRAGRYLEYHKDGSIKMDCDCNDFMKGIVEIYHKGYVFENMDCKRNKKTKMIYDNYRCIRYERYNVKGRLIQTREYNYNATDDNEPIMKKTTFLK
jgi:hypothetical protein